MYYLKFKEFYVFLLFSLIFISESNATTYYSKANGSWSASSTWGTSCGSGGNQSPGLGDDVVICSGYTVTVNSSQFVSAITINSGGVLSITSNTLTVTGVTTVSLGGTFKMSAGMFITSNDFTMMGIATITAGIIRFNGGANQQIYGNGMSQIFYDIEISKSAGTLTIGGATTTLDINNLTFSATNSGSFMAPATLNLTGSTTASLAFTAGNTGIFTAGTLITINGNWTNNVNAGCFSPNGGLVKFVNGAVALINGTATAQTFYDLETAKTAHSLTVSGNTTALNLHNFTQTSFLFNASGASSLFSVSGNFLHSSGTFTPSDNIQIGGNITDNNSNGLTWGTTVTLNGSNAQTIGGTEAQTFNALVINNTSNTGITLQQPATINTELILTNGYVYSDATNLLIIKNGATSTSGSSASFVSGPMKKIGAADFVFPVGSAGTTKVWARLGMENRTHASATTAFVCTYYYTGAPYNTGEYMPGTMKHVSYKEYWDLERTFDPGNNAGCFVRLYWEDATRSGINTDGKLLLAHYYTSGGYYEDLLGATTFGFTGSIVSTIASSSFSPFTFGTSEAGNTNPLPIELLSFDAKPTTGVVNLTWTTASELNNDFFTLEKSSDAINFDFVGKQTGAGNSTNIINYSHVDENPIEGLSYYRLKQTDFDGNVSYSDMKEVNLEKNNEPFFVIYPNPSSGNGFNLKLNSSTNEKVDVVIFDVYGNKVYSDVFYTVSDNKRLFAVNMLQNLSLGVYTVIVTSSTKSSNIKLVVN